MGEDSDSSTELAKLVDEASAPAFYKLRSFSENPGSSWIETPLLDSDQKVELSAEFIFETLKYFVDCGQRLTQMTKTYDDIDAVTRLLEEKERDLELAARIGQSLLEQNNELKYRVESLESELTTANESVTQLKHELANKNGLIQMYNELEADELEEIPEQRDKTSLLVNWQSLHDKIVRLEEENTRLRRETTVTSKEIEIEEKRELILIRDCAKQLTDANIQLINLQEELGRRTDDSINQQEEITQLLTQAVELQRKCRQLSGEKEGLEAALQISQECQEELSQELLELKEKYELLLRAYHELQEELRRNRHSPPHMLTLDSDGDPHQRASLSCLNYLPFSESLAAEIESSLGSEGYDSEFSSLTTFDRLGGQTPFMNTFGGRRSTASNRTNDERLESPQPTISSKFGDGLGLMARNKLKIVKPFEGSQTLRKWRQLATPHLGVILESQAGVQSKTLRGVDQDLLQLAFIKDEERKALAKNTLATDVDIKSEEPLKHLKKNEDEPVVGKLFEPTSSIYTFTTTSLSQCREVTMVTPSFSSLQLATGHSPPLTSVAPTSSSVSINQVNVPNVNTNVSYATLSINKNEDVSPNSITNILSNIFRNTSSYLSSKSVITTIITTPPTLNSGAKDCRMVHLLPNNTCLPSSKDIPLFDSSGLSLVDLNLSSTQKRPSQLPIVPQVVLEQSPVESSFSVRSPQKPVPFAGLASLNASLGSNGILMRGHVSGPPNLKPPLKNQPSNNLPNGTVPPCTVTYLPGFNALLINSSSSSSSGSSLSPLNDKNFVGRLPTIKTLRKGGFV